MNNKYLIAALIASVSNAHAGTINKSHTFTAGGTASASQVNANFDQLFAEINAKETRIAALEGGGGSSPWTVGAGLIYYTGNVGIGTASPARLLHVNGPVRFAPSSAPSSPVAGDIYFDSGWNNKMHWHDGSAWQEVPRMTMWDNHAYSSSGAGINGAPNVARNEYMNSASLDGAAIISGMTVRNTAANLQKGYMGVTSHSSGFTPNIVFGHTTTASDYAERMRIDYNGNVGIGTTTPESLLDVRGMLSAGNATTGINNPNAVAVLRSFTNPHLILEKSGVNVGGFAADSGNMVIASEMADITFRTNVDYNGDFTSTGAERVRINNDGDVGIGTDDPQAKLHIVPTESGGRGLILDKYDNAEGGELLINGDTKSWNIDNAWGSLRFSRFGANLGGFESVSMTIDASNNVSINAAGSLQFGGSSVCTSAGCLTAPSDRRLKENIRPLEDSLARIRKLKGVSYDWIDRQKYRDGAHLGFIAQELEETFPEVVLTDKKTGMKSVSYGHLVAPLAEAIKSLYDSLTGTKEDVKKLQVENAELKARAERNERELASMKERLERLEKH